MSEEALQLAVKRLEAKGKGEKERCTNLNIEFQRIARRDLKKKKKKKSRSQQSMQRNRGKQQNGKDEKSLQEN